LIAIDRDPHAVALRGEFDDERFELVHSSFSAFAGMLAARGISAVDGILFDLGVSSPQLDDAQRGFSFRVDAPLDMRMDRSQGETAADLVAHASEVDLANAIFQYGEERFSRRIARALVEARSIEPIVTTGRLATIVRRAVPVRGYQRIDPATRTFQALRIWVNRELDGLDAFLVAVAGRLRESARLVVISFHSLEDRIVKRFMAREARGDEAYAGLPDIPPHARPRLKLVGKLVRPTPEEIERNPRSRSARLRIAERLSVEQAA